MNSEHCLIPGRGGGQKSDSPLNYVDTTPQKLQMTGCLCCLNNSNVCY